MENEDDILETALNSGIGFAAEKYNITKEEVYKIVRAFQLSIGEGVCSCERARLKGVEMMCFMCDNGSCRIII